MVRYGGRLLMWAVIVSIAAGLFHLVSFNEHRDEWWGYATIFMLASIGQIMYGLVLALQPWASESVAGPPTNVAQKTRNFLRLGLWLNVFLIVLYVEARTIGMPFAANGEPEPLTWLGVASKLLEWVEVILLWTLLRRLPEEFGQPVTSPGPGTPEAPASEAR